MKKHTKIYLDYFNYKLQSDVACELCSRPANDIHHIVSRGMGGSKLKDNINNLMALCRICHVRYGDKKGYMDFLINTHQKNL